jgi:hypothetical protein
VILLAELFVVYGNSAATAQDTTTAAILRPPIIINSMSHNANVDINFEPYSSTTTFLKNRQTIIIGTPTGDIIEGGFTPGSLTVRAADSTGESSVLTFTTEGSEMNATLQIGGFEGTCFSAQAPPDKVYSKLLNEIGPLKIFLPKSTRFAPLIDNMNNNPTLVNFLVGRPQPIQARRKSTCDSVCECCESGSLACCGICAICNWFDIYLTNEVNTIAVFTTR